MYAGVSRSSTTELITAPLVSPSAAWTYYGTATTHTIGVAALAGTAPEITELARALGAGRYGNAAYSLAVYEYVRNNVEIEFRFGLSKGARGAIIDQSGTAFDQAQLMVALLRANGIAANYEVGTISLTAVQFQAWTNLANPTTGLIQAATACQFLADGAIPATINGATTCAGLTGTLSTTGTPIVMAHIWVSANGQLYDPSYKIHVIKTGVDLAYEMNCGNAASPSCGSTVLANVPATASLSGVPYVPGIPSTQTNIEKQLTTYATTLQTYIQQTNTANVGTINPNMQVEDLIGGSLIDLSQILPPATGTTISELPSSAYSASPQYTWSSTNEIPDQFRTTFIVQMDNFNAGAGQLLYADETAGNRLRIWGLATNNTTASATRNLTLYSEYRPLVTSALAGATGALAPLSISLKHPYAANSGTYASETLTFNTKIQANGCEFLTTTPCSSTIWQVGVISVIQGWGSATENTVSHFSALQKRDVTNVTIENPSDPKHIWIYELYVPGQAGGSAQSNCIPWAVPTAPVSDPGCFEQQQGPIAAAWLAQSTRLTQVTAQVNYTAVQQHHSVGVVVSGQGLQLTDMSAQTTVSANATTALSSDRLSAFNSIAANSNRLEGSVLEQMFDSGQGDGAVTLMTLANSLGTNFLQVNSTNFSAVQSQLLNYTTGAIANLQTYLSSGYTLILPQNGYTGEFCLSAGEDCIIYYFNGFGAYSSSGSQISYVAASVDRGTGGIGVADPANAVMTTIQSSEYTSKGRKRIGVNVASGDLTLSPAPDLVTGSGSFPFSLSYQRYYSPTNVAWTSADQTHPESGWRSYGEQEPGIQRLNIGPTGWTHNFGIYAKFTSDGFAGMGRDSALNAAGTIAAVYVERNLNTSTPDIRANLATIFATQWLGEKFWSNEVTVVRPPSATAFVRLPDQSFNAAPGTAELLTQTGSRQALSYTNGAGVLYDSSSVQLSLTEKDGSVLAFAFRARPSSTGNLFMPSNWSFPSGVVVSFAFDQSNFLTGVSNNLNRSLSFVDADLTHGGSGVLVTDDSGRTVSYNIQMQPLTSDTNTPADNFFPTSMSLTGPDTATTTYNYVTNPLTATGINRQYSHVSQWIVPTSAAPYFSVTYDSLYRVSGITDSLGYTTNYFAAGLYGRENQKRGEVMEPLGSFSSNPLTTEYFDLNGLNRQTIDPLGRTTSHVYDTSRRVSTTIWPEGNSDVFSYDIRSNQLSVTHNPVSGSTLTATMSSTAYMEGPTVFPCVTPATCNQPYQVADENTHVTTYAYLTTTSNVKTGQLQRITGQAIVAQTGGVSGQPQTDYCYTNVGTGSAVSLLAGEIKKVDASTNRVRQFAYNPNNDWTLSSVTVNPGTTLVPPTTAGGVCGTGATTTPTPSPLVTSYVFDAGTSGSGPGNVSSIQDPNLNTTNYTFDAMRRLTSVSAPLSAFTRYCYDADGELLSTNRARSVATGADPNSGTETTTGQCSSSSPFTAKLWESETRTYFPTGDLQTVADAAGNTTTYAYDPEGRQQVVQDPVGRQSLTLYDLAGEVLAKWRGGSGWIASTGLPSRTWPTSWTPSSYTATGPLQYESYCNGAPQLQSQNCYSANGKPLFAVDADGHMTEYQYDGLDRLRITYFPDPVLGTLCTLATTDGANPTCTGQQTYELSTYDAVGNRLSLKTRRGDLISHQFDTANHEILKTPAGQGAVSYGLDLLGEPYEVAKALNGSMPAHTTIYTYDGAGRKSTETNDGLQITYQYDNNGNRSQTTWPGTDAYYVSYSYDALNRMQFAREKSATTNELAYYTYDPLSRRNNLCLGAGLSSCLNNTAWTNQVVYGYEALDGQLNALTHTLNTTTVGFGYARNAAYQIETLTATDTTYLPAPAAGVSTSYMPNGLNEYGSIGNQTSTYDLNGNLMTWYPPGGEQTYAYDSENRLITAAVGGTSTPTISYDYDGLGRRVSKTVNGVVTSYLLDGDEEIAEYNGSTLLRRYITGPGVDDRIAHLEVATATKTYYHTNHQGSVMAMTDNVGNVTESMSYDEYGNGTPSTGEQFGYTGRRFDPETGLYYYRARYYAPQLGRFLQTDPVGYKDDIDLYTYTGNDPLDRTDPSGNEGVLGSIANALDYADEEYFTPLGPAGGIEEHVVEAPIAAGLRVLDESIDAAKVEGQATQSLRRNMEQAGRVFEDGDHAHHVVAQGAAAAKPARDALARNGISVHNEANGAAMGAEAHSGMHTTSYYQSVNEAITGAATKGRDAILKVLRAIGEKLENRPPPPPKPPATT